MDDGKARNAIVSYKEYRNEKDFWMSKKLKNEIESMLNAASLERHPQINFNDYKVAPAENVKDGKVKIIYHLPALSEEDQKVLDFQDSRLIGIRIVNNLNGCSIYIEKDNIILEKNNLEEENYVSLTYENRMR